MTMHTTTKPERRVAAIGASLALLTCSLIGCAPDPAPTPTPTPAFASEDEAFAAAEEVYRAYNEALNALDPADPRTFEPLFALTSGGFEAADRENFSVMHAEGHVISGEARVLSVAGESASPHFEHVVVAVCLDVSAIEVTDAHGASLVVSTRPDVYALSIELVAETHNQLTINASHRVEDERCSG
jgi:hypothetical protein